MKKIGIILIVALMLVALSRGEGVMFSSPISPAATATQQPRSNIGGEYHLYLPVITQGK